MLSSSLLCTVITLGLLASAAIELSLYFFKVHRISGIIHTEDQMISCLNIKLLTIKARAFALLYITTITSLPPLIITHQQYFKTVQTHIYSSLLQTHDRYYNQPILKVQ